MCLVPGLGPVGAHGDPGGEKGHQRKEKEVEMGKSALLSHLLVVVLHSPFEPAIRYLETSEDFQKFMSKDKTERTCCSGVQMLIPLFFVCSLCISDQGKSYQFWCAGARTGLVLQRGRWYD